MAVVKYSVIFWALCAALLAQNWSQTNVQYLYGDRFDAVAGGDRVDAGIMHTVTLEHASSWAYGSHFFFVDLASAAFASGVDHKAYAEWAPALSLGKILSSDLSWGIVKDLLVSGELNQGENFQARNLGLRVALALPGFHFADVNFFFRDDNFNAPAFQWTLAWNSTFEILRLPLIFEGFLDYYGVDGGTQTLAQPKLLIDGTRFGVKDLDIGVELYYFSAAPDRETFVPQLALKWQW